ncbi:MAG TPA: hypothetical protein ENO07_03785, partial [candidate division Zixibacteria bacterium]|nr:hypothetical protein [candidate division Zixibacteria bacterium]
MAGNSQLRRSGAKLIAVIVLILCIIHSPASAIGPFEIADSDSSAILRFQLAGQFQTLWESRDRGDDSGKENSVYMKVRRVRPTLMVTVPDYKTSFKLHLSAAPGAVELMDLYFDSELLSFFAFRIGQYKIPFTRYRIQSFQRLTLVDWAIVTKYFGAERQMGIAVHNGYEKPPRLAYVAGIFNGVNARASHTSGLASLFGEKVINRSDLSASSPRSEFHPELVFHFAYNANSINVRSDSDAGGGGLRYSIASSIAWDIDPTEYHDLALRAAQEFLVKYEGFSVMGAGYLGFSGIGESLRSRLAFSGLLIQSAYRTTGRVEFSLRYAHVKIEDAIADEAFNRAQSIIAETEDDAIIS